MRNKRWGDQGGGADITETQNTTLMKEGTQAGRRDIFKLAICMATFSNDHII